MIQVNEACVLSCLFNLDISLSNGLIWTTRKLQDLLPFLTVSTSLYTTLFKQKKNKQDDTISIGVSHFLIEVSPLLFYCSVRAFKIHTAHTLSFSLVESHVVSWLAKSNTNSSFIFQSYYTSKTCKKIKLLKLVEHDHYQYSYKYIFFLANWIFFQYQKFLAHVCTELRKVFICSTNQCEHLTDETVREKKRLTSERLRPLRRAPFFFFFFFFCIIFFFGG